jgi:serine/threonine protein kinase
VLSVSSVSSVYLLCMRTSAKKRKGPANSFFDCSNLDDFVDSIVQALPFKGSSQSRFYNCEVDGVRFLTKLCFYRKTNAEIYGRITRGVVPHIEAEINILRILRQKITEHNLSPCILEMVGFKICDGLAKITPRDKYCEQMVLDQHDLSPQSDVEQLMCKYVDLVRSGLAHDKCAFLVLDKCDMTFDDYLCKSINTPVSMAVFKSLLFQIIYTIYVIHRIYPKFRHYDLHTENIMLKFDSNYKFKATNPKFLSFPVGGHNYLVPYFGIIPKIIDFGFSVLPEEGVVSNIIDDRLTMYYRSDNDILFLFHWIHLTLAHTGADKLGRVEKLLSRLEPNRAYVQYYTEYIRKISNKIPTYEQMITNPVWDEYKKIKIPKHQIYNAFDSVDILSRK